MVKKIFAQTYFVDSAFAALFAYRDYNDLLFYRGKSAGQLDRILHKNCIRHCSLPALTIR